MKKRLIAFTICTAVFGFIGLLVSFMMTAEGLSQKLFEGTFMEGLHNFIHYNSDVEHILVAFDLGPVFYIAVAAVVIITALKFIFLRVEKVDDTTVPATNVKQTTYAVDYSKDAIVPSMVVVNEEVIKEGE